MTMPSERTRAVIQTRKFLQRLAVAKEIEIPDHIRVEAHRLLRHYPSDADLQMTALDCPDWWASPQYE